MELKGLCKDCLGCNLLQDKNFEGVEKCEWIKEEKKEEVIYGTSHKAKC